MKIGYLNAFTDNYIWFLRNDTDIVIVDPGESSQVLDYIIANNLRLSAIILTHDHADHIGGVKEIVARYNVPVYGMCDAATIKLESNQVLPLLETSARVILTPGHTLTSICYLINDGSSSHLFCGDTVFAAGCGRVFTGDFEAMYQSLQIIAKLDHKTFIYPAHEYTLKNLDFAMFIEPNNIELTKRYESETSTLAIIGITLPTVLELELKTNPFFRTNESALVNATSLVAANNVSAGLECFKQLRELRNNF